MASEKQCSRALDQHEATLARNPLVQGLGIVAEEGEPVDSEKLAVAVYVERKPAEEEIDPEHQLPETLHVEHEGETVEVPLRIIEQGPVTLEGPESFDLELPGTEASPEPDDSEE